MMRRTRTARVRCTALVAIGLGTAIGVALPSLAGASPDKGGPATTTTSAPGRVAQSGTAGGGVFAGSSSSSSTGLLGAASGPARRLGARRGAGGVSIRVYAYKTMIFGAVVGGLPASCFPDEELVVDVSTAAVAASVSFGGHTGQAFSPAGQILGVVEGKPAGVVVVQVPKGTRRAVMRFAGGQTDSAAPFPGGWAVLASPLRHVSVPHRPVPLLTDVNQSLGSLRFVDRRGRSHPAPSVTTGGGYPISASCLGRLGGSTTTTTLSLPQSTGPAPTNPTAARQAVEAAYRAVFTATASNQSAPNLEGGPALSMQQLQQLKQDYGDILGKISVRVNDFRFLSPTEAVLSFDLLLNGQPITATTIGRAVFVDGQWKVARATFCEVVGRGGVRCM